MTLRTRGLRVRFRCAGACTVGGRLTIGASTARRYRLGSGRRSVTVGRGAARLRASGSGLLSVRLTTRARRALRNARRVTLSLRTELVAGRTPLLATKRVTALR